MKLNRGYSLIEILIALGIGGIVATAMTTMIANLNRQTSALTQKVASVDIQRVVTGTLADGSVCTFQMTNPPRPAFDPLRVGTSNPPTFPMTSLLSKAVAGAPPVLDAVGTASASPITPNLVANAMRVDDLQCVPQPCTASTNQFTANLTIEFDYTKLNMALRPLKFPLNIQTSGTAGAQVIVGCSFNGSAAPGSGTCPSGFSRVGQPGVEESFCISSQPELPYSTMPNAILACFNKTPKSRLCEAGEWVYACLVRGAAGNFLTGRPEWVADYGDDNHGEYMENSDCYRNNKAGQSANVVSFRCCIRN